MMPNYIRYKFEGPYYFFTVVTYDRRKLFCSERARHCLREAIIETQLRYPYESIAFCPIKHGLVKRLEDWPWSTFHRYVREGFYGRIVNLDDDIGSNPIDFGE